jgi:hypothetical protein
MMPYTQTPNFAVNQLPPTLYFSPDPEPGTQGDPGGGSLGGGKKKKTGKKTNKKTPAKAKKKR